VVDLLRLLPDAPKGTASPLRIIDGTDVVVAHLDEDEVARLRRGEKLVPVALGLERATAPPPEGAILDLDLRPVEMGRDGIAPALLFVGPRLHRRVAYEEERGLGTVLFLGKSRGRQEREKQERDEGHPEGCDH